MKKLAIVLGFIVANFSNAQTKILFDATKGEVAGNADWIVDADSRNLSVTTSGTEVLGGSESNAQRIPTGAQSNITSTTSETYWTGALSYWAVDLAKKGYVIETLPYNGKITYGDTTNAQDLKNYKVFVVDEPNIKFSAAEKNALVNFVKNGGGLFMIADHTVSDRNNDGWDSPAIWNDLFTTNTVQKNPFGITFDLANFSETTSNIANISTNTILHGVAGNPTKMQFSNGTSMTLNKTNNSTALGLVFRTGASNTGTSNAMFATAIYGTGKVCALGDSSVPDDGTGDTGDTLYNGYTGDASGNHRPLLINAAIWLASAGTAKISTPETSTTKFTAYPNPSKDFVYLKSSDQSEVKIKEYYIVDKEGKKVQFSTESTDKIDVRNLMPGVYFINVKADNDFQTLTFIKK